MRQTHARRKGNVAVLTAVCLVGLLGVTALSLDGGLLLDKRRHVQAAADAAALAAASELFATTFTHDGKDDGPIVPNPSLPQAGSIALYAKKVAKDNGYEDGVGGVTVTVNIPPKSGPFTDMRGHAEVIISAPQQRHFSRVFGSSEDIPYGARAVARGTRTTVNNGIIVLNPTKDSSFTTGGGGTSTIKGNVSVIVNSNSPGAMNANGGSTVTAPEFDVTGGWVTSGGATFDGTIKTGVPPTPDPLRFVPEPNPDDLIKRSDKRLTYSQAETITLNPGLYEGGISIGGQANIILNPGIYYVRGGFTFSGQGTLTGSNIMIFNYPMSTSDAVSLSGGGSGGGSISLTPMDSGPYAGISIFQSRTSPDQPTVGITGNGGHALEIKGTFYVPKGELKVTGNGDQDTIGSQYISDTLTLGGNGTFNVDWDPGVVPGIRQLWLVE
jgi:Flp pilus assembly protein TadG